MMVNGLNIDKVDDKWRKYVLCCSLWLGVTSKDSAIASFSPANLVDLFYVCKIYKFAVSTNESSHCWDYQIVKSHQNILVIHNSTVNCEFSRDNSFVFWLMVKPSKFLAIGVKMTELLMF